MDGGAPSSAADTGPSAGPDGGTVPYFYANLASDAYRSTFDLADGYPLADGSLFNLTMCGSSPVTSAFFQYHMFGEQMGTLSLKDAEGVTQWSRIGQQSLGADSSNWMPSGRVSLKGSASFYFHYEGAFGPLGNAAIAQVVVCCPVECAAQTEPLCFCPPPPPSPPATPPSLPPPLPPPPSPPTPPQAPPAPPAPYAFTDKASLKTAAQEYNADPTAATATYGPIADWDVSAVTDMSELFSGLALFNADISSWDTSAVTNMYFMFGVRSARAPASSLHSRVLCQRPACAAAPTRPPASPARISPLFPCFPFDSAECTRVVRSQQASHPLRMGGHLGLRVC